MVDMFLGDWLGRRASLTPDRVALYDAQAGLAPITYRSWNAAATRTAALLRRIGVGKGDRVAVLAYNSLAYLDLWFACGKLGAILQALNWRLTSVELTALVADAAPTAFVYGPEFTPTVHDLRSTSSSVRAWVALDATARAADDDAAFAERDDADEPIPTLALGPNAPWVICYTGGTTGLPKGAVLTHGNVAWNAINTLTSWGLDQHDVAILNAPLFHTGGLNVFTAPLVLAGGASIVCRGFDVGQVFDLVAGGTVTLFFGVPTMFAALQQHPRWPAADFSRLKLVISGGAPCPAPIFAAFWERGVDFKTGYGLTEAGPNTFWLPPADVRRKPGAVGHPLLFVDVRVAGEDGELLGPGRTGELQIRGPHVCAGYWNRPEETAKAFTADGWLHTGDLAAYDAEGCYTIVGRSKDVIISGGENIYPAEVESVLCGFPAVAEAALIAAPDAHWGEVGWAIVVPRAGHSLDPEALLAFAAAGLARYKLPRRVILTEALPKTSAGKIDKQRLVKLYVLSDEELRPMPIPNLPGISSQQIDTPRLRMHVLGSGPADGVPVLFVHGNVSSATFWEETMLALPAGFRAIAPDLRGYGDTEFKSVDATRGLGDFADDLLALLDTLGVERFHAVGHSLGGSVLFTLVPLAGARVLSVTLAASGSPYGFGGTKDAAGTPCWPDFAGCGGGLVNPEFVKRLSEGDRSSDHPQGSPRVVMNSFYWKPPFQAAREEELLSSMLAIHVGADHYPGDLVTSEHWPGVGPGVVGPNNALAPKYVGDGVERFLTMAVKPPVLWVRGADDQIVSDTSLFDIGFLGKLGAIPGWPGDEAFPPQPMIAQIRAVLDRYASAGGTYQEVVFEECGHTPYLEKPAAFNQALHRHLAAGA